MTSLIYMKFGRFVAWVLEDLLIEFHIFKWKTGGVKSRASYSLFFFKVQTDSGMNCAFPFNVNGVPTYSCIVSQDLYPICQVSDGTWANCIGKRVLLISWTIKMINFYFQIECAFFMYQNFKSSNQETKIVSFVT